MMASKNDTVELWSQILCALQITLEVLSNMNYLF